MYLRIKSIKGKGGIYYSYLYLVKNFHIRGSTPKQKVIKYLGKVKGMQPYHIKEVFKKNKPECGYCKVKADLTIDHIIPYKLGGNNDLKNLQILCRKCNLKKGSKLVRN